MNKDEYELPPTADKLFTLMDPDTAELAKVELQIAYLTGRIDAMTEANAKFDLRYANLIKTSVADCVAEDVDKLILKKANRSS